MTVFNPEVYRALQKNKLVTKRLREPLALRFKEVVNNKDPNYMVEIFSDDPHLKGNPFYILERPEEFYELKNNGEDLAAAELHPRSDFSFSEIVDQIDFAKVTWDDEQRSYKHPYIDGIERLHWHSLVCPGCGNLYDNCDCCPQCGASDGHCVCSFCPQCGENIDAGDCNCERCPDCGELIEDCTCEQPEDLPSANDGPGEGLSFA